MLSKAATEELRRIWEQIDRTESRLEKELVEVREKKAACEIMLEAYAAVDKLGVETELRHAHIRPSRIAQCRTQVEAFEEIARLSRGIVRVTEASRLVHSAGLSQGKARSIASGIRHKLLESDDWELVEPGTFRLLSFVSVDEVQPDGVDADEITSESPGAADAA